MSLHTSEDAFLRSLAEANESWLGAAREALASPTKAKWSEKQQSWSTLSARLTSECDREALQAVLTELLSGLTHSVLVTLDGGSALAETTILKIQDEQGVTFKSFLHEFWPRYSNGSGA
jgi:hypothetical protein